MFSGGLTKKLAGEHLNRYFLKTGFLGLKISIFTPIWPIDTEAAKTNCFSIPF
jgi:hypothetical protein